MYNPLASKYGRLAAFFLLYVTEGVPQGFALGAVVTQLKRAGVGVEMTGALGAAVSVPWALKWLMAPFVDVFYSRRLGRRRGWILVCQVLMVLTLLAAMRVDFHQQFAWFVALIALHNVFAATQDVAIDALAVSTLDERERGLANGLMFAGAYAGTALGDYGALFVIARTGLQAGFLYACASILVVTVLVTWWLKERPEAPQNASSLRAVGVEIAGFVRLAWRSVTASRAASLAFLFALLPAGAMSLAAPMGRSLAVDLGLSNDRIIAIGIVSASLAAGGCVLGGWLSDRLGRRRSIAVFILMIGVPTLVLAVALQRYGWVMPVPKGQAREAPQALVSWYVWTGWASSLFVGLMYGTRTALYMDVVNPAVAATQFTAYMSLMNAVIAYTSVWTGWAAGRWGYPTTMAVDAALGCVSIALLPFMTRAPVVAPRPVVPIERGFPAEGRA